MKKVAFSVASCLAVIGMTLLGGCSLFGPHIGTISGRISIAGYPVPGVTVSAGSASATTDSNGNYTIDGVADGSYTVTPTLANYGFAPLNTSVKVSGTAGVAGVNFDAGPALTPPAGYNANVVSPTPSVLIAVKPLGTGLTFSPTIYGGYLASGTVLTPSLNQVGYTAPQWIAGCAGVPGTLNQYASWQFAGDQTTPSTGQRVTLVDSSGNIVPNPTATVDTYGGTTLLTDTSCSGAGATATPTFEPLTQKPLLELTAFWQLLGTVTRYGANTNTSVSQTVTYGVSQSSSQSFSNTVKASAGVNIDGFSASISDTFSQSTSNSMSITSTNSTTDTFQVDMPSNREGVYAVWQLVYQVAIVRKATASEIAAHQDVFSNPVDSFGYVLFSDPNFEQGTTDVMSSTDLAPVDIYQENDVVPQMTLFIPPTP